MGNGSSPHPLYTGGNLGCKDLIGFVIAVASFWKLGKIIIYSLVSFKHACLKAYLFKEMICLTEFGCPWSIIQC